jgi:hypothetical protein
MRPILPAVATVLALCLGAPGSPVVPIAGADCEIQPSEAKWCNGGTISWSFGQGLTGSLTGAPLTIKLTVQQAIADLNFVFAEAGVPIFLSGPSGTPGTGITFTYGVLALGASNCSTSRNYAKTKYNFSYSPGNAMASIVKANVDFNNQFSGWTSPLALTVTYHEMGHALGLAHVYNDGLGGCPLSGAPDPLMSETLPCTASPGPDASFERGIRCLYGPDGVPLNGVTFTYNANGSTRTTRSHCSGQPNCTSFSPQAALTYELAISDNGGPYTTFATLTDGDWVENGYDFTFPNAHTAARVRMRIFDGPTLLGSPTSDAIDIPAPVGIFDTPGIAGLRMRTSPNPFRSRVRLDLELAERAEASLVIADVAGRRIARLYEGSLDAGGHAFFWDGQSDAGTPAPAGVYYAHTVAGSRRVTRAILRLP